ncbi:hypothetical protein HRM2_29510 [Desulforapulum autotrophicum HRM2]|uniref:DUF4381 domain-containing protein n=1 Tax=Desulforapulum autotrophicum (strain ATCC 43914 / DSM 3382 / VKM B-1955 / HRM2) TaxID=177437 RepID=C0QK12_DESAH|nr:hypothetical protein [Desulforapulum autotrophicum]ACN16038.1 hypothetical protein HRM2_29510 [Desulforapulum autotrophicum HRM2]
MQDIHDIRPPVQVGMDPFFLKVALIALALMLLVCVALLVYRYLRRKKSGPGTNLLMLPMPLPPLETALSELGCLDDLMVTHPRYYYFRLTEIIKRFIGKAFKIKALEMNTQELTSALREVGLDRGLFADTREFLLCADMIKYAGQVPSSPMMKGHLAFVRTFVTRVGEKNEETTVEEKDV